MKRRAGSRLFRNCTTMKESKGKLNSKLNFFYLFVTIERPRDLTIGPLKIGIVVAIGLWQTPSDFLQGRKRGKKKRERESERENGGEGRKVRCYLPKIRCPDQVLM